MHREQIQFYIYSIIFFDFIYQIHNYKQNIYWKVDVDNVKNFIPTCNLCYSQVFVTWNSH